MNFAVFPLKIRFFVLSETQFMIGYGPPEGGCPSYTQ